MGYLYLFSCRVSAYKDNECQKMLGTKAEYRLCLSGFNGDRFVSAVRRGFAHRFCGFSIGALPG